jgi:hypothetical protein
MDRFMIGPTVGENNVHLYHEGPPDEMNIPSSSKWTEYCDFDQSWKAGATITFSRPMNREDCRNCPQGKISALSLLCRDYNVNCEMKTCQMCPTGKYTNSAGQSVCTDCGAGKYTSYGEYYGARMVWLRNTECHQELEFPNAFVYYGESAGRSVYQATGTDPPMFLFHVTIPLSNGHMWRIGSEAGSTQLYYDSTHDEMDMADDLRGKWREACYSAG